MKKTLRLSILSFLMLFCGTTFADTVVTFEPATDHSEEGVSTLTKDGVTISIEAGTSTSGAGKLELTDTYRFYKGNDVTISSAEGNIAKIVFTCKANNTTKYGPGCFASLDGYSYEGTVGTWEGSAESVTFTASSNQVRATKIEVTIGDGGVSKKAAELAFSESTVNYEVGTEFTAPTFTKGTTAAVTFASDNEEVAKVDAEGNITLGGTEGKAVITASSEENDEFLAGSATCTVYVYHMDTYKKVTKVEAGQKYLLVAQRDDKTYHGYTISGSNNYGYMKTSVDDGLLDEIKIKSTYLDYVTIDAFEDGYSIKDSKDRYLYFDGSHASFQLDENEAYAWEITPNEDGTFNIAQGEYFIQFGDGTYTTFGGAKELSENAVKPMLFQFYDPTNGISNAKSEVSVNSNARYNLAGQRVNNSYKGIVIMNGKKFMNK